MGIAGSGSFPKFIVVMGVSGSGKSTVAAALAEAVGGNFLEGDKLHPPANIEAMSAGRPLTDDMRYPWLEAIASAARGRLNTFGSPVVIACSALKRRYRNFLANRLDSVVFVHLAGDNSIIQTRLETRRSHFMPPSLLGSQLADLERPDSTERAVEIDIDSSVETIVRLAVEKLALLHPAMGGKR